LVDADGVLELNSSAGAIGIGTDADAQNIDIGIGAAARTITVGNITGATAVNVNSGLGGTAIVSTGTGDITVDSDDTFLVDADDVLELNSSAGAISIGNDDIDQAINIGTQGERTISIGTGAFADAINIGNQTTTTSVTVTSGTGGIELNANDGSAGTDDVVITGNNFSVTDAGVMAVEGAITAASFSGTMVTSSLSPAINEALTISTTTNDGNANDHITFNSVDNVAINAEGDILLDADGDIVLDAAGNNITMKVSGTDRLDIFNDNGDVVIQSKTNLKDIVFKQFNGTEVLSLNHDLSGTFAAALNTATFDATGTVDLSSSSGVTTIGSTTGLTVSAAGVLDVNNTTDASSSTDGSMIIDGGVGIAKKLYVGTNL
ncbi:uncharacterized protein METZ01_LOCUS145651, partial [marine metagenome]